MKRLFLLFFILSPTLAEESSLVDWTAWDGAFDRAKSENKLVLLDLEAIWCHWCHVMDQTTYRDPKVVKLLATTTIPVKVDQDSRPDLANRYQEYGWPATIIFDSEGRELARLSGYVEPDRMAAVLERLRENPEPLTDGPQNQAENGSGELGAELLAKLERRHDELYDDELGAWGRTHKFVNAPVVEYCLQRSLEGDERNREMVITTLNANLALIDPEWGGVYQYSDSGVWDSPHYEKIMKTQAGNLRVYSLAFAQFGYPRYEKAAKQIADYLLNELSAPDGGFYASQDADLIQGKMAKDYFSLSNAERRKLGIPRIDTAEYARENGQAAEALALYSAVFDDKEALIRSQAAASWAVEDRQVEGGGFRHSDDAEGAGLTKDPVFYLGDTLYMGRAFLMLYRVTSEPEYLQRANHCGDFIAQHFAKDSADGYYTSTQREIRDRVENIDLSRFAHLLYAHTGEKRYKEMAEEALRYFTIEDVTEYFNPGGLIQAVKELETDPAHITIVVKADTKPGRALFREAAASPVGQLRLDYWQIGTPLPPFSEIEYPVAGDQAAYVCTKGQCSAPIETPEALREYWRSIY